MAASGGTENGHDIGSKHPEAVEPLRRQADLPLRTQHQVGYEEDLLASDRGAMVIPDEIIDRAPRFRLSILSGKETE